MLRLQGKVVLITGAAQGTGEGVARRAVAEGARVLVTDVQEDKGNRVAASLGDAARFVTLDVTREDDWRGAVATAVSTFGRLDGLVNNAALLAMGLIETTTVDTIERLLRVNQLGVILGVKSVAAAMREAGGGSIVIVSSVDGLMGMNGVAVYSCTKWGIRGFARSAAIELGRDGIRVNCVCPSAGNIDMVAPWFHTMNVARHERFLRDVPPILRTQGQRAGVTIDDITPAICFLLSDESARITGTDIAVDAGWTAGHVRPGLPGFLDDD